MSSANRDAFTILFSLSDFSFFLEYSLIVSNTMLNKVVEYASSVTIIPAIDVCYIRSLTFKQELSKSADGPLLPKDWEMGIFSLLLMC